MKITGVVQAGGKSTRMGGRPKALIELGGRRIVERVLAALAPAVDEILIVTNSPELYAFLGVPMVVVYRISGLSYRLGRPFVSVPHFAMVNLIAGRGVVPELMQSDFTPEKVAAEAALLLDDAGRREAMRRDLAEVRRRLGEPGASARAAGVVAEGLLASKKP